MAKVRNLNLVFFGSGSPDVVGYKLYYVEAASAPADGVDYNCLSVDLGMPAVNPDTGKMTVDLVALGVFTNEANYNLGIVAVDDVGNESSMEKLLDVPFDLVAPDAPTEAEVIRI